MTETDEDILRTAQAWREAGRAVAIATVVETWGSAPWQLGSHLVVDNASAVLGSVSGSGGVESDVAAVAGDVIATGVPRLVEFVVADETARQAGFACGGRIKIYIERLD